MHRLDRSFPGSEMLGQARKCHILGDRIIRNQGITLFFPTVRCRKLRGTLAPPDRRIPLRDDIGISHFIFCLRLQHVNDR
jgi:hypothetical protein